MHVTDRICGAIIIVLASSCATNKAIQIEDYAAFPRAESIPVHVDLRITPELIEAAYILEGLRTQTYRVGEGLVRNSELLADALFEEVTVSKGDQSEPLSPGAEVMLIPQVVAIERTVPNAAWSDTDTLVDVEWELVGPEGETVWASTVRGAATGPFGTAFGWQGRLSEQLEAAIHDQVSAAFQQIQAAPEIRSFSEKRP